MKLNSKDAMRRWLDDKIDREAKRKRIKDKAKKLQDRSDKVGLLEKYSEFLMKNGYMDTDWKDEEPYAIDEFLKQ